MNIILLFYIILVQVIRISASKHIVDNLCYLYEAHLRSSGSAYF